MPLGRWTFWTLVEESKKMLLSVIEVLQSMVCSLYRARQDIDVNKARYKLFNEPSEQPPPQSFPLTKNALHLHFQRDNYKCLLQRRSLYSEFPLPNSTNHCWVAEEDGSFAVQWTINRPAPESMLDFVSCSCSETECQTRQCHCLAVNLSCTDLCSCKTCKYNNVSYDLEETDEGDMNDNDSEDGDESSNESGEEDLDAILGDW